MSKNISQKIAIIAILLISFFGMNLEEGKAAVTLNLSANNQNIKPITSDYSEIIEINNEIVALGNYGIIAIINQNTNIITKIKVFDRGVILGLYNLDDKVIAFNDFGQIAESNIDLKKWSLIKNNNFNIDATLQTKSGFILKYKSDFYYLDNNFEIKNEIKNIKSAVQHNKKSFIYFNDKVLITTDTNLSFLVFDDKLNRLDSISLWNNESCNECKSNLPNFYIYNDKLIFSFFNDLKRKEGKDYVFYFESTNLNDFDLLFSSKQLLKTKFIKNQIISINNGDFEDFMVVYSLFEYNLTTNAYEIKLIYNTDINFAINMYMLNDFIIKDNKIFVCGVNDFICVIDLNVIKLDYKGNNSFSNNLKINTFVPPKLENGKYSFNSTLFTFESNDDFNSFTPIFDTLIGNDIYLLNDVTRNKIPSIVFNDKEDNLLFIGNNDDLHRDLYFSKDEGKTFEVKNIGDIDFSNILNMVKVNETYAIISKGYTISPNAYPLGKINFLTKDSLKILYQENIRLDSVNLDYVYLKEKSNVVVFLSEFEKDNIRLVNYSIDGGKSWQNLKTYNENISILKHKQIKIGNIEYFCVIYYDLDQNKLKIDSYNLNDYSISEIYSLDINYDDVVTNTIFINSVNDSETINNLFSFTLNNKIYIKKSIDSEFEVFELPENGKILDEFIIYDDNSIITAYSDDNHEKGIYWLKDYANLMTSIENEVEEYTFIQNAEPYPNPTNNKITVPIYWGKGISITIENIEIYDLMGNLIPSNDNLKFENFSDFRGFIFWNTTNVPKGTYLIKIQHGNNTKTVKVVVN